MDTNTFIHEKHRLQLAIQYETDQSKNDYLHGKLHGLNNLYYGDNWIVNADGLRNNEYFRAGHESVMREGQLA